MKNIVNYGIQMPLQVIKDQRVKGNSQEKLPEIIKWKSKNKIDNDNLEKFKALFKK